MVRFPNPVRFVLLSIGRALARAGLISGERVGRTTELAWPRIVTGLARMSKNAVDVAMVGVAVGPVAITGLGFANPYWGVAFTLGGGIAAGTIALVSQRFGAGAHDDLGVAVRASAALVLGISLPVAAVFWLAPAELIGVMTDNPRAIDLGATYLQILALGVPFAGLNLVGSRVYIGADDAWTPMLVRGGGALANIVLSAVLIFGLDLGVTGAAVGTVLSNALATGAFVVGLVAGRIPGVGELPLQVNPFGSYLDRETMADLVRIGLPVVGRNGAWTVAKFPMLTIVGLFGSNVVAAYVIARRILGIMNTPGWGFGLASSSLVGQALGEGDEGSAESYGRDIVRFSMATYLLAAVLVAAFARPIVGLFVGEGEAATVAVAVPLVYAACVGMVPQAVKSAAAGPLDASGDTRWTFYSQALGMFGVALPLAYLGATTSVGLAGLYLALLAETTVPAAINYHRFSTGKWKAISREFRPDDATPAGD